MRILAPLSLVLCGSTLATPTGEKHADNLMAEAFSRAKYENKAVFVVFHASWCGWCKKLEDFLGSPTVRSVWKRRVVTVWIDVMEADGRKADETPGGMNWLVKAGGTKQGLPFTAFYSAEGKFLVNSREGTPRGQAANVGYPTAPNEVAWFMKMVAKGAPNVTPAERAVIERALRAEARRFGN